MVNLRKFEVGDFVRFRSWDDMKEEFGTSNFTGHGESIPVGDGTYFVPSMKCLCGTGFMITGVSGSRIAGSKSGWTVTPGMLELVDDITEDDANNISDFLTVFGG